MIKAVKKAGINYKIMGSANLDLCQVACGNAVGYIKTNVPVWDYSAGKFIIENASGFCCCNNKNIIATNKKSTLRFLQKILEEGDIYAGDLLFTKEVY